MTRPGPPVSPLTPEWRRRSFTGGDEGSSRASTYDCYERGTRGPGVVLLPELPGITPEVLGLGDHLVAEGYTVTIPSLFGEPGGEGTALRAAAVAARVCVSAEFRAFALNADRPVAGFLRALARDVAARRPGHGVGVVGLCFTGGFALAAAVEPAVLAAVLSQPSVPLSVSPARRADAGVSETELRSVHERTRKDELCVLGLRFSRDMLSPEQRFATLGARLGDGFRVIPLSSERDNPGGFGRFAHSVLTREVRETPGHPARRARADVVAFLDERLKGGDGRPTHATPTD
ncbi:dienelactone hydrolase family protein [Streptomyces fructofermentans]|uniref:dienelactone hydrolase family protein n=1 Tax=Streptomyces fructofermentans TaxID=152141 RepID=UPI00379F52E9